MWSVPKESCWELSGRVDAPRQVNVNVKVLGSPWFMTEGGNEPIERIIPEVEPKVNEIQMWWLVPRELQIWRESGGSSELVLVERKGEVIS